MSNNIRQKVREFSRNNLDIEKQDIDNPTALNKKILSGLDKIMGR